MKGVLTVEQQLSVLGKIWGGDREGFIFLPWIDGKARTKEARRKGYHEGPAFEWPADRDKIKAWLSTHTADDLYFTPCLFEDKRRIEQAAAPERSLWADMDEADPQKLAGDLRPTIAWESSPGRFQAVWLLSDGAVGLSWPTRENQRLTMAVGADPSGWDTTQLLRVPGRLNHKYVYGDTPRPGTLLWDTGPRYSVSDFADLPEIVSAGSDGELLDDEVLAGIDRHDVWARVRLKVTHRVRDLMGFRSERQITEDMDRSEILWSIARDLADAGCNGAEIIAVIKPTVWNKYSGRGDELKRLKELAGKVIAEAKAVVDDGDGGALEVIEDEPKPEIRWLSDVMSVHMRRPRWIINNVWSEGGCGFIAGDPKSYKSWTGLDMAVSIATGTPFLGDPAFGIVGGPRPVLYLQEEDGEVVVRDRLDHIVEGKCPDLHWHGQVRMEAGVVVWSPPDKGIPLGFHVRTGFISSDPGWQAWLAETIQEGEFGHVVIDTMGTTAGDVDTDKASDLMGRILRPLRQISGITGAGITIVHHNKKGSGQEHRGGSRMLGSVALHAWVDDALYIHSREQLPTGVTKVRIERESKAAVEHRWTLEVPRMGADRHGNRTVWTPTVGLWDANAEVHTGDTDRPDTAARPTPTRTGGKVAGSEIMWKVKQLRGNEQRPITVERVAESNAMSPSSVRDQLGKAIENGLLKGSIEGGVWWE